MVGLFSPCSALPRDVSFQSLLRFSAGRGNFLANRAGFFFLRAGVPSSSDFFLRLPSPSSSVTAPPFLGKFTKICLLDFFFFFFFPLCGGLHSPPPLPGYPEKTPLFGCGGASIRPHGSESGLFLPNLPPGFAFLFVKRRFFISTPPTIINLGGLPTPVSFLSPFLDQHVPFSPHLVASESLFGLEPRCPALFPNEFNPPPRTLFCHGGFFAFPHAPR